LPPIIVCHAKRKGVGGGLVGVIHFTTGIALINFTVHPGGAMNKLGGWRDYEIQREDINCSKPPDP